MGFRFRKSVSFGPLLRLNLSKTGTSWSVGRPGLTVNLGRGRVKTTVGAPGTGLSYSESRSVKELSGQPDIEPSAEGSPKPPRRGMFAALFGPDVEFFRKVFPRRKQ